MPSFTSLAAGALLAVAGASAQSSNSSSSAPVKCATGLKMFVARGTKEPMGLGETGKLVERIAKEIPGSDIVPVLYPASMENPTYFQSVGNGTMQIKSFVTEYAKACPDSKMALFGYSQGGQIISNTICGTPAVWAIYAIPTDDGSSATADVPSIQILADAMSPLPNNVTKNVISVTLFGDPSHTGGSSFAHGNATGGSGIWLRGNIKACEAFGPRLRSYCDAGDPFCDEGGKAGTSLTAHGRYVLSRGDEVTKFVVAQFRGEGASATNGSTTAGAGGTEGAAPTLFPVVTAAAHGLVVPGVWAVGAATVMLGMM